MFLALKPFFMKKYLFFFIIVSFSCNSYAQIEGCDGSRYIDDIFTEIKVTKELKYGEGETIFGNFKELYLDVYEPEDDELSKRPVIILAFGGSFISGAREDLDFLCEAYARKGYVAVTIDYRLFDGPLLPLPTANQMKRVVIRTLSDMKAAIRYMRQDADTDNLYRIDPNRVFVGGISAGSITAFHTAVMDDSDDLPQDILDILEANGGLEGNTSDNYEYSSDVQGLINFSGGLNDASWIDENDPPFVSIHDDMDDVVPYAEGFAMVFGFPIIYMEGSRTCQEVGDSVGVVNRLKTIENSDVHVSYLFDPMELVENIDFTAAFIADIACADTPTATKDISNLELITAYPNPTSGLLSISETNNDNIKIDLIDIYGRKISSTSAMGSLDMSNYANGIYFLKLTDLKSENTRTVKVVLEK